MLFSGPSFSIGFAAGFGTGFFTREISRMGKVSLRPAAKVVVRSTLVAFEKLKESLAVAGETFEDLVAEARTELATPVGAAVRGGKASIEPTVAGDAPSVSSGNGKSEAKSKAGKKG